MPWLPRQLAERGPLIFWRDGVGGAREGLACVVETCRNRNCDCREVLLHAIAIDAFVVTIEAAKGGTALLTKRLPDEECTSAPPNARAMVRVDIDTGEVLADCVAPDAALVEWIRDEIDGELLDLLQRRWLRGKGREPGQAHLDVTPEDWTRGRPLNYASIYPDDRDDIYVIDGRMFIVIDMFSLDSDCSCDEASIFFEEVAAREELGKGRHIGTVDLRVSDGRALAVDAEAPADRGLMRRLWNAFRKRHRVAQRLKERQAALRKAGAAILAQRESTAAQPAPLRAQAAKQVGRNDPCPCGSGKKYKRCCRA
jgi:hypothetical protein